MSRSLADAEAEAEEGRDRHTSWLVVEDAALEDVHENALAYLLRTGGVRVALAPPRGRDYPGETPIGGPGAVARWVALHLARDLRAALRPGDLVGERQVRRAIRSLLLYEHQLTPKTRRHARTTLWRRERPHEPLAAFLARVSWSRCRCVRCQPQPVAEAGSVHVSQALREGIVLQSA